MKSRIADLRCKEIINVTDGSRFGYVGDVEVDLDTGQICALVVPGRLRLFGLLGRGETLVIDWGEIEKIGTDALLVSTKLPETGGPGADGQGPDAKKPGLLHRLLGG